MQGKIRYAIIGGGWRAEFYLRIAQILPERFSVVGIYIRNPETRKRIAEKYTVSIVESEEALLALSFDFAVVCTKNSDISLYALSLCEKGVAVLCETPGAMTKEQSEEVIKRKKAHHRIQVAEQFHLKPLYQAYKRIIESGMIGKVSHVSLSCAHDYHAMSLIRFFLGTEKQPKKRFDTAITSPLLMTNWRTGELTEKKIADSVQTLKLFDFDGKTALYDYTPDQYFSPIRKDRVLIRGDKGEIAEDTVRYFNAENVFCESKITRHFAGNLDGFYQGRITFESTLLYQSPFLCARLSDEETAIAECLVRMKAYLATGKEFYPLEEAVKDAVFFL